MEIIHSETYSLLIDTYIINTSPKTPLNETTYRHLLSKTVDLGSTLLLWLPKEYYSETYFLLVDTYIKQRPRSMRLPFGAIEQSLVFPD
jgi:hypothetical protein